MAMLFAMKNNPYKQILSIVGVSVGDLWIKQISKLETGKKSTGWNRAHNTVYQLLIMELNILLQIQINFEYRIG